jgi:hypothetical protein
VPEEAMQSNKSRGTGPMLWISKFSQKNLAKNWRFYLFYRGEPLWLSGRVMREINDNLNDPGVTPQPRATFLKMLFYWKMYNNISFPRKTAVFSQKNGKNWQ